MVKRLETIFVLCVITSSVLCADKSEKPKHIPPQVQAELDLYSQHTLALAIACLIAGHIIDSGILTGVGLGSTTGTLCAVLENSSGWVPAWIIELLVRQEIVRHLCASTLIRAIMRRDPNPFHNVQAIDSFSWGSSWFSYLLYQHKELAAIERGSSDRAACAPL